MSRITSTALLLSVLFFLHGGYAVEPDTSEDGTVRDEVFDLKKVTEILEDDGSKLNPDETSLSGREILPVERREDIQMDQGGLLSRLFRGRSSDRGLLSRLFPRRDRGIMGGTRGGMLSPLRSVVPGAGLPRLMDEPRPEDNRNDILPSILRNLMIRQL